MLRPLYIIGLVYVAFSGVVLLTRSTATTTSRHVSDPPTAVRPSSSGSAWFQAMKPYCNSVEVETRHRWTPPPSTDEGAAYSAACFALAGKIDRARAAIEQVPNSERWRAAGVVFNIAHPVADAGDDLSAGPIMELVLEFWPNHYMALYHAGMSRYALGHHDLARTHLKEFLEIYKQNDGWRRNARNALAAMRDN